MSLVERGWGVRIKGMEGVEDLKSDANVTCGREERSAETF